MYLFTKLLLVGECELYNLSYHHMSQFSWMLFSALEMLLFELPRSAFQLLKPQRILVSLGSEATDYSQHIFNFSGTYRIASVSCRSARILALYSSAFPRRKLSSFPHETATVVDMHPTGPWRGVLLCRNPRFWEVIRKVANLAGVHHLFYLKLKPSKMSELRLATSL